MAPHLWITLRSSTNWSRPGTCLTWNTINWHCWDRQWGPTLLAMRFSSLFLTHMCWWVRGLQYGWRFDYGKWLGSQRDLAAVPLDDERDFIAGTPNENLTSEPMIFTQYANSELVRQPRYLTLGSLLSRSEAWLISVQRSEQPLLYVRSKPICELHNIRYWSLSSKLNPYFTILSAAQQWFRSHIRESYGWHEYHNVTIQHALVIRSGARLHD